MDVRNAESGHIYCKTYRSAASGVCKLLRCESDQSFIVRALGGKACSWSNSSAFFPVVERNSSEVELRQPDV